MLALSRDLQEFATPLGATSNPVELHPCIGEGSFPASAERRYVVPGTIATVKANVEAEATALGWSTSPSSVRFNNFAKGDRNLSIEVTLVDDSRVEVWLAETGGAEC